MKFVDVYETPEAVYALYDLLAERTPEQAISHKQMPTFDEHCSFVRAKPYPHWYLVIVANGVAEPKCVGTVYLTDRREIGIFIFREFHRSGYGQRVLEQLMSLHPGPLFANVSPHNAASQAFFIKNGFAMIQHTYKID